jgi:hypothetical protein
VFVCTLFFDGYPPLGQGALASVKSIAAIFSMLFWVAPAMCVVRYQRRLTSAVFSRHGRRRLINGGLRPSQRSTVSAHAAGTLPRPIAN